jgi:hypothetical protein
VVLVHFLIQYLKKLAKPKVKKEIVDSKPKEIVKPKIAKPKEIAIREPVPEEEPAPVDTPDPKPWFDPVTELDDDDDLQHVMLMLGNSSEPGDGKLLRIGNLACGHVGNEYDDDGEYTPLGLWPCGPTDPKSVPQAVAGHSWTKLSWTAPGTEFDEPEEKVKMEQNVTKKVKNISKPKMKKEIVKIVKKAKQNEGNIQVKPGTAPKIGGWGVCPNREILVGPGCVILSLGFIS